MLCVVGVVFYCSALCRSTVIDWWVIVSLTAEVLTYQVFTLFIDCCCFSTDIVYSRVLFTYLSYRNGWRIEVIVDLFLSSLNGLRVRKLIEFVLFGIASNN
ncbi:hypothetical protein [Providencia manganoxydans]|uniref:hypothetical protein n=1 Tax=Providencia manganoxydans TaxID=2923283 RepID=UPI0032DB95A6